MTTERRRGAPRSEAARVAILQAAAKLFAQHGYDHLTMEGIAAEAQVGKQTIYRWWPSKSALIADCLIEGLLIPEWLAAPQTGDLRADLTQWLSRIVDFVREPGNAELLRSLVVAAAENEDVARRLNERLGMFPAEATTASAPSTAASEAHATELGEALIGAVVIRTLRRGPLEPELAKRIVDAVLGGSADA